jgi:hypothetical protein
VYFCVLRLTVVLLPPGKNEFAVQLKNNNKIITVTIGDSDTCFDPDFEKCYQIDNYQLHYGVQLLFSIIEFLHVILRPV